MSELSAIEVDVNGVEENVFVDEEKGPKVLLVDGSMGYLLLKPPPHGTYYNASYGTYKDIATRHKPKLWNQMSSTEQKVMLHMAAKKNRGMKEWKGEAFWQAALTAHAMEVPSLMPPVENDEATKTETREQIRNRCLQELARPPLTWTMITQDTVKDGHEKRAPGMIYGLEFPWTEDMLAQLGPSWLTKAFQAAGTLGQDNKVTKVMMEKKIKVTTGNNGGKFLFEVAYAKRLPGLHTKLFAKIPFPLSGATRSDRLSSSVNKQPQEFYEINTYRLLEGTLPMQTPKFYYGDISNETSNWILITERVAFADHQGMHFGRPQPRREPLGPFEIEGPYDKCIDHNLRGPPEEYYMLLVRTGARMAGMHKSGELGDQKALLANFGRVMADPKKPETFGVQPEARSGEPAAQVKAKLGAAVRFFSDTGKVLFPSYVTEEAFQKKLETVLLTLSAYNREIDYWKHSNPDYTALCHSNLNVDNAYFWRNEQGKLDCGIFDWGAMGAGCLGHKLWWWLYCSDYDIFRDNLKGFVRAFVDTYQECGGPAVDAEELEMMVIITAMEQMAGLVAAVPQIMRMCPAKEWPSIQDRYDPRIANNIDGKSTLRLYLSVMCTIMRIIEEMGGDQVLQSWIRDVWVGKMGFTAKPEAVVMD